MEAFGWYRFLKNELKHGWHLWLGFIVVFVLPIIYWLTHPGS